MRLQRGAGLGRDRVAADEQHRVARLRRPAGRGHRVPRVVGGRDQHGVALLAPRRGGERVDRAAEGERVGAGDLGRAQARGRGTSPIRTTWALPSAFAPVGARAASAFWLAAGRLPAVENSTGASTGSPERTVAATATRQSRESTSVTAFGPRLHRRPGIHGARDARGVGDRVAAADPRRVLGGERREAEVARGVVGAPLRADRRLRGGVAAAVAAALPAAGGERGGTGEREDGEQERAASHLRRKIASSAQMNDDVYSSDMDFRLSDDQLEFQRHCHAFARDVMRPAAARHDREQRVPYDVIREARARGLHGIPYLERVGADETGIMNAIYARSCTGAAPASDWRSPRRRSRRRHRRDGDARAARPLGRAVLRRRRRDPVRRLRGHGGRRRLRRPLAAHDRPARRRRVGSRRREGLHLQRRDRRRQRIVATVDRDLGHRGQASFVVEKDTPGLRMGKKDDKLGIRASQTAELVLDGVRVPMANLLGGLDRLERKLERARSGERSRASGALATFEITRPMVGASAVGIARAAYEWTIDHLEGRSDEHGPLLEQQRVQQVLADVATEIDAAACSSIAPRGWAATASR
jgi:hypothetical protein